MAIDTTPGFAGGSLVHGYRQAAFTTRRGLLSLKLSRARFWRWRRLHYHDKIAKCEVVRVDLTRGGVRK